jgi:uncharacterized protein
MTLPRSIKLITKTLIIGLIVLVTIALAVYLFQDKLIFQAVTLERNYQFSFSQPYEEHFIPTTDGHEINALWFKPSNPKGLVIYFHGNADNLQRWGNYASDLTQLGYEVLMMDYRGYGKSSGSPNEKALYDDAGLIWNWAKEKTDHQKIIVYGRSLGSAVATHLAAEVQPNMLILETPFDEIKNGTWISFLFSILPLHSEFPTKKFLAAVKCKTVIFHGTKDWIINIKSAERLKPLLKQDDEFIVIQGGGHRNLGDFDLFHTKLAEVLR